MTTRRKILQTGATLGSLLLVSSLAGCGESDAGDTGGNTPDETGTETPSGSSTPDYVGGDDGSMNEEETPADLDSQLSPGEYQFLEFGAPITLEYETSVRGTAGTLVVEVSDVGGDTATFDIRYTRGDVEDTATISGDFGDMYRGTYTGEAEQLFALLFINRSPNYHNKQLDVGEEWDTRTGIPGENTVTVTGTDSHAGIECYTAELTIDGDPFSTLCLRPGFGIPLYSAIYSDGAVRDEATLVGYDRP